MLLRLKDLSLRAKIKFLRELPAHYQTPVSATPSAAVHEEVATFPILSPPRRTPGSMCTRR